MKKKILVIAPQSYPVTGAEAIVNTKMLQAMARSGAFEVDLVSKKDKWQNYESEALEELGLGLSSLNIIEVDNKINLRTLFQHLYSIFLFGVVFKGCHWAVAALPVVLNLIKTNKYDYVLTKNAPSLLLGYYLKKKYGIKWVATWNDPYPEKKYPFPYGEGWDSKNSLTEWRLISIMRQADSHIFPSERIRDYMLRYLHVDTGSTLVLPHVVFPNSGHNENKRVDRKLKIIHSGNLRYPRDPKIFLEALRRLSVEFPEMSLELTFQGVFDNDLKKMTEQLNLDCFVKFKDPVPYSESLFILKDYDVALIIEADCEEGIFLPTKVSDFMQCGKPIFAISPRNGVLSDLYQNSHISYFAPVSDPGEIYLELKRLYLDYLRNVNYSSGVIVPKMFEEEYIIEHYLSL